MKFWAKCLFSQFTWVFLAMHVLASRASATSQLDAWGDVDQTMVPADLTNIVAIASGHFHNVSLDAGGALHAWPVFTYDPGSQIPPGLTNVMRMAGGLAHDLAVRTDGTVVSWGDNSYGQTDRARGTGRRRGGRRRRLSFPGPHGLWGGDRLGDNSYGQSTIPAAATNIIGIAAGFYHSVALRADGTLICWGDNSFGQGDVPD